MFRRIYLRYRLRFSLWLLCANSVALVDAEPSGVNSIVTGDQVIAAQQARLAIEATDEQLSGVMHRLESALDEAIRRVPEHLTESDFGSERDAILLLDQLMAQLIEQSDSVLAAQQEYLALGKKYREELTNARPTFEAAAKQCREYAAKERYSTYRQADLNMAGIMDEFAVRCEKLPADFNETAQDVAELFPYLQDGRQVLVRFRSVLAAIPVLKSAQDFDALDERLKAYVQSYEHFRGSLQQLHDRLRSDRPAESDGNVARIRNNPAELARSNRAPTSTIQFASSRTHRDTPREPTLATNPEPTWATPSIESEQPTLARRDVLLYSLPGRPDQLHESEVLGGVQVREGQPFRIRIRDSGTVPVNITGKAYLDAHNNVQYWRAEFDSTRF